MCYSTAPSTTNQNVTPKDIYKGYKVARKSLQAYSIKIQYENVFKGDRWCSCYTCLPQTAPAAQTTQKVVAAQGTGTGAPVRITGVSDPRGGGGEQGR